MRVYVSQYGYWWSFALAEWLAFCEAAVAAGGSYEELPPHKELHGTPYHALKSVKWDAGTIEASTEYVPRDAKKARVVYPLDWELEQWEHELEEVRKLATPT